MRICVVVYNLKLPCLVVVAIPGNCCYLNLNFIYICICVVVHDMELSCLIIVAKIVRFFVSTIFCRLGQFSFLQIARVLMSITFFCKLSYWVNFWKLSCNNRKVVTYGTYGSNQIVVTCHVEYVAHMTNMTLMPIWPMYLYCCA